MNGKREVLNVWKCLLADRRLWLVRLVSRRVVSEEVLLAGTEIAGGGGRGRLYLTLHCHRHNDSCIEMGTSESPFNVSLTVRGKVIKTVSTDGRCTSERLIEQSNLI